MRTNKWMLALSAVAVSVVLPCAAALAQDAAAPAAGAAAPDDGTLTLAKYIAYGGWVGNVIIVCSVIMVALIIEHSVNIRRDKLVPPEVVDELEALLQEQEYQDALNLCQSEPNFVTNMVGAALGKMAYGFDEMLAAADDVGSSEVGKLKQKISYIVLLANLGPMLGLFGTVWGMVGAFGIIVSMGANVTPAALAGGVQQALITTVDGLLVAMPCIIAGFYFANKVSTISGELKSIAFDMLERFRPQNQNA